MIVVNLLSAIVFIAFGLMMWTGKYPGLMGGYQDMSKEEQAKWDEKALGKLFGWMFMVQGIAFLIACAPIYYNVYPIASMMASWFIFLVILFGGVIYMYSSPRFKHR